MGGSKFLHLTRRTYPALPTTLITFIKPYKWCSNAKLSYLPTALCLLSRQQSSLVMVISVVSYETREVFRTVVNGKLFEREDVTQIYVIEPMPASKPQTLLIDTIGKVERGMVKTTVAMTIGWCAWLWWAFS